MTPPATPARMSLGRAHLLASALARDVQRAGLRLESMTPVGSLRRFKPDIGDVTQLVIAPHAQHPDLIQAFARLPIGSSVVSRDAAEITLHTERGAVRVLFAGPDEAGAALVWHTGSRAHVDSLRARATRLGMTLEDGRLTHAGTAVTTPAEEDVYRLLELPLIAPELRAGLDEIEAAEQGRLPALISGSQIRGDLHMHSTWSDGRDSIEDMVISARRLGYEYVAITDHSQRAWSARALHVEQVARQREEIEAVREKYPDIEVLHGLEVEIMPDGVLDFDDDVLEEFEFVLASLHDPSGQDAVRLAERYLGAIRHPLVNLITHPANRSPAGSQGYALDFERLFAAATEAGTALEVDGGPAHLDMDGALARRAVASGATLVVNSDSHRADAMGRQMRFGIGTARRGWVEAPRVLNTGSVDDVRAFVARKRRGRAA